MKYSILILLALALAGCGACGKMLQAIASQPGITKDEVAEAAGISKTSSGLGSGLNDLRKLMLIEECDGGYRLTDGLR